MRLLKHDREAGWMRLQVDTLDDLWTLRNLLREGDVVTMDTHRTAEASTDKIREGKPEKKRMRLAVRVESVEWHDFDDHLRILGTIEEGPQDHGRHHTHVVRDEPGTRLDIRKRGRLQKWHYDMVREAEEQTEAPQVVLLAIDDSEAQFAVLRGYGVQWLGSLPAGGQGKRFAGAEKAKETFYDEALNTLKTLRQGDVGCIIVGPGWWREEFLHHVEEKEPALAEGLLTDGTSQGGRRGIHEALRRGMIEKVARDHRVAWEIQQVEKVMEEIAKDGLVAYGPEEVRRAVQVGAVEELLVTDKALREGRFEELMQEAERTRSDVHVVASGHEAGHRLDQLTGIAALLRFPVS